MPSQGADADRARAVIRAAMEEKGHTADIARRVLALLEDAFASGALQRTDLLERAVADLGAALTADDAGRVGGKSAEAARLILRAVDRGLDAA